MYVIKHSLYQGMTAGKEYENYEDAQKVISALPANMQNLWYVDGAKMEEELLISTYIVREKARKVFNAITDIIKLPKCMKFKTVQKGDYYEFSVIYNETDEESVKTVAALKTIAEALYA